MTEETLVGMYEFLEALEAVVKAADPSKRTALADVIDAYADSFPEEFAWAIGAQAPTLLHNLMMTIDASCRPEAQSTARPAIRLVPRRPESGEV